MGLIVPSVYVDKNKITFSNVYIAVAHHDIVVKNKKIDPYKGCWVTYRYGIWSDPTQSWNEPITALSNTIPYSNTADISALVYSHLKSVYPGSTDA